MTTTHRIYTPEQTYLVERVSDSQPWLYRDDDGEHWVRTKDGSLINPDGDTVAGATLEPIQ